jgi:DNA-binding Xre family transcriptional regulator
MRAIWKLDQVKLEEYMAKKSAKLKRIVLIEDVITAGGISRQTLSNWRSGVDYAPASSTAGICHFLECQPFHLWQLEVVEEPDTVEDESQGQMVPVLAG